MSGTEKLAAKVEVAIEAVERLLRICEGHEPDTWTARYSLILTALRQGRYQAAIAEESKLVKRPPGVHRYDYPCWVVSEQLAKQVEQVVSRIRTDIWFGDQRAAIVLPAAPDSVDVEGTRRERADEIDQRFIDSIQWDPIDKDPAYALILEEVEELVEDELRDYPRGIGFCHIYWEVKQRILKERYFIDWSTPAELNPHILFD
jgi:hypothetical protein